MRRRWLFVTLLAMAGSGLAGDRVAYPRVPAEAPVVLPRDYGAHPGYRLEWWYVTGWLDTRTGPVGFQVTFFRTRLPFDDGNPSRFAARQLILAHVALADPAVGHLEHGQRLAREGFGLASAATTDTDVSIDDWKLVRVADGSFDTRVVTGDFTLDLKLAPTQAPLLQGDRGYSRKGPDADEASAYFSVPHLSVTGRLTRGSQTEEVRGTAWLDREWSSNLLNPRSVGWDWAGLNMDDGSALTVFRVRDASGRQMWAGGSLRDAGGALLVFGPDDVRFETRRAWRSPRTGASYPVETTLSVATPSGTKRYRVRPLMDDQELDTRPTGGPVYWEGAVRVDGGKGYLELVGYGGKLRP
ncbi:lipocalin-like domain-containing protein [Luteibacter yeojuensis]|uniref:Carotenoid 1,2-hydratase n=1 Tax=Luteibacter yeojuensis TaxID=345309 RepID=A0A7X5QT40_9GAMM|nr:lipocalin-like domain-containing protein [Luteibacter yeojuensis]NID14849.1 carotenoid 1,2-hydratase [Luteibacter yeojuensis]